MIPRVATGPESPKAGDAKLLSVGEAGEGALLGFGPASDAGTSGTKWEDGVTDARGR
jgi:hypothetical protein